MKKLLLLFVSAFLCCQFSFAQNALQFTAAIPNYVQVGNTMNTALTGNNTITVEAWCFLTGYTFLPTAVGNYGSGMQFLLRVDGNRPAFWVDNGTFRVVNGATTVPLNTWTHLAGVWNGSVLSVYINGVLDGTASVAGGTFNATTNPVRIGASLTSEPWGGKLDDVRIWSTARTATADLPSNRYAEIAPHMEDLFQRYGLSYNSRPLIPQVASSWHRVVRLSLPNGWLAETTWRNAPQQLRSLARMARGREPAPA